MGTIIVNNYSTEETDNQEILDNFETTEGNQIKYKENNYGDENSKVDVENKEVQDTSVILGSQEDNNLEDNTNIRTSLEETVHPEEQYNTVNTEEQENTNIEDNSVGEKSIIEAENKEQQDNAVTAGSQEENVSVQASQEQQGENGEEGTTKIEENVSTKMMILIMRMGMELGNKNRLYWKEAQIHVYKIMKIKTIKLSLTIQTLLEMMKRQI